jgi:hypothetical protein
MAVINIFQINVVGGCKKLEYVKIPYSHVDQHDIEKNLVYVLCHEKLILVQTTNTKCDDLRK